MRVRFNLLVAASFILLVLSCDTDGGEAYKDYFIRYFGMDGDHYGADMTINTDGTVVILGTSEFPANSGLRRIYLSKTDSEGNTLWEKLLGEYSENAKDIEPIIAGTYTGGYLILSNKTISGNSIIKVLRVDADGNKIDSLELDNIYQPSNFGNSITTLSDGGFIVTGNTTDTNVLLADNGLVDPVDQTDLLSLRYTEGFLPDPTWQKSFGGEPEVMGVKIIEINATQFYFAGYSNALHSGESSTPASNYDLDFWYVKLNGQGSNSAPSYSGGQIDQEKMNAITKSALGEYFAVGSVTSAGGNPRVFASRIVGNFSIVDLNDPTHITVEGEAKAVAPSGANKILILGDVTTPGGSRDIWLTKVTRDFVDEPGFPLTFGASGNDDTSSAIAELPNGDIVILGTMNLVNQNKIALIKLKSNGEF